MGFNFPSAPAVGDLHPVPAQVGLPQYRWDGTMWVTVVAPTMPRYQRVSLAGGKSFDVQVPADANVARITGVIVPSSATAFTPFMQISLTPGVFLGAGSYSSNGFQHYTGSPGVITTIANNTSHAGFLLTNTHANALVSAFFEGVLTLKRINATVFFSANFQGLGFPPSHTFVQGYQNTADTGLSVLALRILALSGDNWAVGSALNVEWL